MTTNTDVLISGAGIAGPTLAYWLMRFGFHPTVVERVPALRTGGHPVDLWGSAVDVVERMGILPEIEAARTQNDIGITISPGKRPVEIELGRLGVEIADRHVEIMRGELVRTLYERTKDNVEYMFGNSITTLEENAEGVEVAFEHGASRRFGLVVGADGLHSNVRRLIFGEESRFRRYLGGYISGYKTPNFLELDGRLARYVVADKTAYIYPIRQSGDAGAGFLFRRGEEFDYDYNDVEQQKGLLRKTFAEEGWEVPRLLDYLERASDFYFDSISQIQMDTWSRGRVTLVGDAGYSPAPGVGGGTTLAVVAAYILAGELMEAGDDHSAAFQNYERQIQDVVRRSRTIGPALMKLLIPRRRFEISLGLQVVQVLLRLPWWLQRRIPLLPRDAVQALGAIAAISLKDYQPANPDTLITQEV